MVSACYLGRPLARYAPMSAPADPRSPENEQLADRKTDHLDLTISGDVGFRRTNLLEQVQLVHCSLPELACDEINIATRLAGIQVRSPIMIASMTGGNRRAGNVNRQLAEVAEQGGYAIGLGSQRAMVKKGSLDKDVGKTFQMRDLAPTAPISETWELFRQLKPNRGLSKRWSSS